MTERTKFLIFSMRKQIVGLKNANKELKRMIQTENKGFGAEDGIRIDESNALKTEVKCLSAEVQWLNAKLKTEKCERGRLHRTLKLYKIMCLVCILLAIVSLFI